MDVPWRPALASALAAVASLGVAACAGGDGGGDAAGPPSSVAAPAEPPPDAPERTGGPAVVELPTGFQPEGIAAGEGTTLYVGSIPTGAVYRFDATTGAGAELVPAAAGRAAIGLAVAGDRLFVAGGGTGQAFVYDAATGRDIAALALAPIGAGPTFVNDVVVTGGEAWFTDSRRPVLYRVDRASLAVTTVPLTGALTYTDGFNANGIEATADGSTLLVVQTNTGLLFAVDPATGSSRRIEVDRGATLPGGDGLVLDGDELAVVQNSQQQVTVLRLAADLATAETVATVTDPGFDAPTTAALVGDRYYVVNARFAVADPGQAEYRVVSVPRR